MILGWHKLGSKCARYLSYVEKLRLRDLDLELGRGGGFSRCAAPVLGLDGGFDVIVVSAVLSEPEEVLRAWVEEGVASDSGPGESVSPGEEEGGGGGGGRDMPRAAALLIKSCSMCCSVSTERRTSTRYERLSSSSGGLSTTGSAGVALWAVGGSVASEPIVLRCR
jgi:hypothetical protein